MHAHKEGWHPDTKIVGSNSEQAITEVEISERDRSKEHSPVFAGEAYGQHFGSPSLLLSQKENHDRQKQPGEAQKVEGPAPTVGLTDPTAEEESETAANCDPGRVDALDGGAHARWKVITEQRERRWSQSRLSDAHHQAAKKHRPEAFSKTRQAGKKTPYRQAARNQIFPGRAIRQ